LSGIRSGGIWSGLNRLLGLLNGHLKPLDFKKIQNEQAPQLTDAVYLTENKFSVARCEGEHLACSPCGKVAGREHCHRVAGPGGAAVALAKNSFPL
jgi:hypothetical protein